MPSKPPHCDSKSTTVLFVFISTVCFHFVVVVLVDGNRKETQHQITVLLVEGRPKRIVSKIGR
jgi:hypothetical protein